MSSKRKTHSAKFKAKIALEAHKGGKTAAELISLHKPRFIPKKSPGIKNDSEKLLSVAALL